MHPIDHAWDFVLLWVAVFCLWYRDARKSQHLKEIVEALGELQHDKGLDEANVKAIGERLSELEDAR